MKETGQNKPKFHSNKIGNENGRREGERERERALCTPFPCSLLPVVMVITGFGKDYEIFYLVASVLQGKISKPACSPSVSLPGTRLKHTLA